MGPRGYRRTLFGWFRCLGQIWAEFDTKLYPRQLASYVWELVSTLGYVLENTKKRNGSWATMVLIERDGK